jgi:hypothetical protein
MKNTIFSGLLSTTLALGAIATTSMVTSCERRPTTVGEKIDDALDNRPAEPVKDAAEDVRDAVKDAAEDTKDAVKDATN